MARKRKKKDEENEELEAAEEVEGSEEDVGYGFEEEADEEEQEAPEENINSSIEEGLEEGPPREAIDHVVKDVTKQKAESVKPDVNALSKSTGKRLSEKPKEKVMIPSDKLNPEDVTVTVSINGWIYQIKRGNPVWLPRPVVDLLVRGGYNPTIVR